MEAKSRTVNELFPDALGTDDQHQRAAKLRGFWVPIGTAQSDGSMMRSKDPFGLFLILKAYETEVSKFECKSVHNY